MHEIVVVGAGPAGLVTGLALAWSGLRTTVVGAPHRPAGDQPDTRTAALFNPSIALLENLGVWDDLAGSCAPLRAIRLIDDTGGLLRAPEVLFDARELGVPVFGHNVPQEPLMAALHRAARRADKLEIVETAGVREVSPHPGHVVLSLAEGVTLEARLVVAADGRRSLTRRAAGIEASERMTGQSALTAVFTHNRPHDGISSEFHRRAGPLTVVPMPGRASSLVWVERPDVAERLHRLDDARFLRTLEDNLQGLLGSVGDLGPRALFPLAHMAAKPMGARRIVLVGEAGHAMPPIGAQGLNLSLRDAAVLAGLAADAKAGGEDIGNDGLIAAYDKDRGTDARERAVAVETLNQALLSDIPGVQLARGAGLHAIARLPQLRRQLMRLGMAPPRDLPPLMRATSNGSPTT